MISRSSYYFLQKTSSESKYQDEYEKKRKSGQAIARILSYYKPTSRCCDGEYFFNKDGIHPIYLPSVVAIVARRKSEVNRKKLSLKTYRIQRVGLNEKFGFLFTQYFFLIR